MDEMPLQDCHAMLNRCLVGRMSMIDPQGKPYVLPMRYVWHQGAVYVRLAYDGRKQDALEFRRNVCFEVDEVEADFSHYASVIAEGILYDIRDDAEKKAALVALNFKYEQLAHIPSPGPDPVTKGVAIRKVVVEKISGRTHDPAPDVVFYADSASARSPHRLRQMRIL